ncbi:MAG: SRPBCC family protein [Deltaproteobacteria bacterium]|nr:SRPBCC family protein [Deltaproteobacteria bacterium]MBW2363194.1 SRPBCC family protein [Deltaproteobacteria bacterium]
MQPEDRRVQREGAVYTVLALLLLATWAGGCGPADVEPEYQTSLSARSHIDLSPELAWQNLRDLTLAKHYVPGVVDVEMTTERTEGVGASRRILKDDGATMDETVVDWREGEGFAFRFHRGVEGPPAPFERAGFVYELQPDGTGSEVITTLSYTVRWGAMGRLLDRFVLRRQIQAEVETIASGLARYYESEAATH